MDGEEFISDELQNRSPRLIQWFQADRFMKNNNLNIPDTIQEQSSVEISGNSSKMETLKATSNFEKDETHACSNLSDKSSDSSTSTIIAVDYSYIYNCERQLLEKSSDKENTFELADKVTNGYFKEMAKKLTLQNVTISTPPSALRKEISVLRNEKAESEEFHDLEIQILKEDNVNLQLLEKYSTLMELYTSLKNEYDEYRREQDKLQYTTADCLESLYSQIEASDSSSLNFSTASFLSADVRSSTMMGGNGSEVEATLVNDATVLDHDPLGVTQPDGVFKTPMNVVTKSARKLFSDKATVPKTRDINSDAAIHLLDIESSLLEKIKKMDDLERRIFKVEDFSTVLQSEYDRNVSEYVKENKILKENLKTKTEQLDELNKKLFTETIELDPTLKNSLNDVSGSKLLVVFIETIMEKCKNVQDSLIKKITSDKTQWELEKKTLDCTVDELRKKCSELKGRMLEAESVIAIRDEEMRENERQKEHLESTIAKLKSETEKLIMELEKVQSDSKTQLLSIGERVTSLSSENEQLKELTKNLKGTVAELEAEINTKEEKLAVEIETAKTNSEIQYLSLHERATSLSTENEQLKEMNDKLEGIMVTMRAEIVEKEDNISKLIAELEELKCKRQQEIQSVVENEQLKVVIAELRAEISERQEKFALELEAFKTDSETQRLIVQEHATSLSTENEQLNERNNRLEETIATLRSEIIGKEANNIKLAEDLEKLKSKYEEEIESHEQNLDERVTSLTTENFNLKDMKIQLEKTIAVVREEAIEKEERNRQLCEEIVRLKNDSEKYQSLQESMTLLLTEKEKLREQLKAGILEKELKNDELMKKLEELECDSKTQLVSSEERVTSLSSENEQLKELTKILEETVAELQTNIREKEEKFSLELEALKSNLETQCLSLQDDATSLSTENVQLKETNEKLEAVIATMKAEITEKEKNNTVEELEKLKSVYQQELESRQQTIDERVTSLTSENCNLKELKDQLERTVTALREEITEKKEINNQLSGEILQLKNDSQTQYQNLQDSMTSVLSEREQLKEMITQLKAEILEKDLKYDDLIKEVVKLQSDSRTQLLGLEERVTSQSSENDELKKVNDGLEETVAAMKTAINEKEKNNSELIEELEKLKREHQQEIQSRDQNIDCRVKSLISENYNLKELKDQLERTVSFLQKEATEREEKTNELSREITQLKNESQAQYQSLQESMASLLTDKEQLEETITQLKKEILEKELKNNELMKKLEELKSDSQARYESVQESMTSLKDDNEQLKSQISESEKIIIELQSEIDEKNETNVQLIENIERLKNNEGLIEDQVLLIRDLKESVASLTIKNQAFKESVDQLQQTATELHSKISEKEQQNSELLQQIEKLKSDDKVELQEHQIETLQGLIKSVTAENKSLKNSVEQLLTDVTENQQKFEESKKNEMAQVQDVKGICQSLRDSVLSLKSENECMKQSLEHFNVLVNQKEQSYQEKVEELVESNKAVDDLKNELKLTNQKNVDLVSEMEKFKEEETTRFQKLEENIIALEKIVESKEKCIARSQQELEEVKDEVELKDKEMVALKNEIIRLSMEIQLRFGIEQQETAKEAITIVTHTYNQLKEKFDVQKSEHLSKIEDYESDAKSLKEKINQKTFEAESMRKSLSELEKERSRLEDETQNLASQLEVTQAKVKSVSEELQETKVCLEREIEEKNGLKQEMSSNIETLQEEIRQLKTKITENHKQIKSFEHSESVRLNNLSNELTKTKEIFVTNFQSENLNDCISKLQLNSDAIQIMPIISDIVSAATRLIDEKFTSEKLTWESEKKSDSATIRNLETDVKKLQKELDNKLLEIENLKKLNEGLKEKLSQAESIIMRRDEEIQDLRSRNDAATSAIETITKLESQLSLAEAENKQIVTKYQKLEETTFDLEKEMDVIKNILDDWEKSVSSYSSSFCEERESQRKRNLKDCDKLSVRLKMRMEFEGEEKTKKDSQVVGLLKEVDSLKKQNADVRTITQRVKALEEKEKNLTDILSDVQSYLNISGETMTELMTGTVESRKIFSEKINALTKMQLKGLKAENQSLKYGNENLKEKIKELSQILTESSNMNTSLPPAMGLRSKGSIRNIDLCSRRLDKLEEINHNLTDLVTRILTLTDFPNVEKLKLCSVRDFPEIGKQVVGHFNKIQAKVNELKAANEKLDEECDSYAKTIKDLKKEAVVVWKTHKDKTEELELQVANLKEETKDLENEKEDLLAKISKLEAECQKLKSEQSSKAEGFHSCNCGSELKMINDLKRSILIKEQKILELQDLEEQNALYKSHIKYLENALELEKKKIGEEKEKNKKLQNDLNELSSKSQKGEIKKSSEENQILDQLRMHGSLSGGVVQEFVDKEKMRKFSKDIGILKELCRARYAEIKRLEAENAALKKITPKNSNQMDSPLRVRAYNTRSKSSVKDVLKLEVNGKENSLV